MTTPRKGNVVTEFLRGKKFQLEGTLFFPHLLTPKQEPNKAPKFGCMVAWDAPQNQQTVQMLQQLFGQVKQQFHGTIPDHAWVNPLKDFHTTKRNDGKPHPKYLTNKKWMNASNNVQFPPQVMILDAQAPQGMRAATPADQMVIYDGQKVVVSVSFFGLHGENAKYGISTNIDAVLVVGGGEKVIVDTGVDVGQAFGNFLSQMGMNGGQQPAPQYNQADYQQGNAHASQHQYQGNGQHHAQPGTQHNGQTNPGNQTQNFHQGGNGQNVHGNASHFNGQPQQQNYYQNNGQPQQGNNGYNNGYNNGNNGGLV